MTEEIETNKIKLSLRVERNEAIPAFAGFLKCGVGCECGDGIIYLNAEACLSPVAVLDGGETRETTKEERIRTVISSLMHEFGHALEAHFKLPHNEEAIEEAVYQWEKRFYEQTERD